MPLLQGRHAFWPYLPWKLPRGQGVHSLDLGAGEKLPGVQTVH